VLPTTKSRRWREEVWLRTTKSWKSLKEFPERLQKIAVEIEGLNRNFFCIPDDCENPTLSSFSELPSILRNYAGVLNHRATIISKNFHPHSRSRRVVELSKFTRLITGLYLDPEVAELLNSSAIAMGYENLAQFDATKITQARHRYRSRQK